MNKQTKERCIYCGADVYYTGVESLIKCNMCGHTLVVAKFENELNRMQQALDEGEQAKKELAEAERARQEAEEHLLEVVEDLSGIKEDQDVLSTLMQSVMAGQESSEDKLVKLQDLSDRILKGQGNLFEGMNILGVIKGQLDKIGMDQQAQKDFAKDYVNWFQDIHTSDISRLEEIGIKSSELLAGQKVIKDKIDSLRSSTAQTQKKLDAFHSQWKESQLEELRQLYHQAENYQNDLIYDKAYDKYEQVITKGGGDAEVMWRLLLCHYCVSYQADDKGNLIPIILNPDLTAPDEMSVRKEFRLELEKIPAELQSVYRMELSKIDRILGKYRQVKGQAEYDVFISVRQQKNGNPTKDSIAGITLFNMLKAKGLKVFNSRMTPPPAGQEYEPYIISALMSSRALIVVGTCAENMQSRWVKNEWSRFQWLMKSEEKTAGKTDRILLCYLAEGMTPEKIPLGLNPSRQAIRVDLTAEKQLMEALKPLLKDDKEHVIPGNTGHVATNTKASYTEPLQDVLDQMTVWLLTEDFDEVIQKHTKLKVSKPYMYDPKFHLYALCAQKQVDDIEKLAQFGRELESEGLFKLALKFSKGTVLEQELLTMIKSKEDVQDEENTVLPERNANVDKTQEIPKDEALHSQDSSKCVEPGYSIEFTDLGPNKVKVIKIIHETTGQSLQDIVDNIHNLPGVLIKGTDKEQTYSIKAQLEALGAIVNIKPEQITNSEIVSVNDNTSEHKTNDGKQTSHNHESKKTLNKEDPVDNWYQMGLAQEKLGDSEKALAYFLKAAHQGSVEAQLLLSEYYMNGKGVEKDPIQSGYWLEKAAEQGDATIQFIVGSNYEYGTNVEMDAEKAAFWYSKSAEQGNADAQLALGLQYTLGKGVRKDFKQAANWYKKSAEQGNDKAQYLLGKFLMRGWGGKKDEIQAANWYRMSADQGNSDAQHILGLCYQNGTGVEKDHIEAVCWFRKSADQGNSDAQNKLGLCYQNGTGVEKDYIEAVRWFRKSADQGNSDAQKNLGVCYASGFVVNKNRKQANIWFQTAADNGNGQAKEILMKLKRKL